MQPNLLRTPALLPEDEVPMRPVHSGNAPVEFSPELTRLVIESPQAERTQRSQKAKHWTPKWWQALRDRMNTPRGTVVPARWEGE